MQNRLARLSLVALVAAVIAGLLALAMLDMPAQAANPSQNGDGNGDGNGADRVKTVDDMYAQVAKRHPGFGGVFINDKKDITYVFLRDGKRKEAKEVVEELEDVFHRNLPNSIKVLSAKFRFLELMRWHDQIDNRIAAEPRSHIREVTLTDVDDTKNQLTLGLVNSEARAWVEKLLEGLDIPEKAINIEVIGPVVADQLPPQCTTNVTSLTDFCRPVVGGLQIQTFPQPEPEKCGQGTLGFIAERGAGVGGGAADAEDVEGFVTNAHLSNEPTVRDGTVSYQPTCATPQGTEAVQNIIGKETVDPPAKDCLRFNIKCRQSDSNFSELAAGVGEDGLGYIARPALNSTQWNGKDTFSITAEATARGPDIRAQFSGDIVTKVGRTTGRTQGTVLATGLTIFFSSLPGVVQQNQVLAFYKSQQGDSGAPVILEQAPDPPNVNPVPTSLLGIHTSHIRGVNRLSFYSPIQGIEDDLGPLNTCAPPIEC